MTKTFEVGKTYTTRSLCDYECVFAFTVTARTAKRITIRDHARRSTRTVGIRVWGDCETAKPHGTYSMCPVINANQAAA